MGYDAGGGILGVPSSIGGGASSFIPSIPITQHAAVFPTLPAIPAQPQSAPVDPEAVVEAAKGLQNLRDKVVDAYVTDDSTDWAHGPGGEIIPASQLEEGGKRGGRVIRKLRSAR